MATLKLSNLPEKITIECSQGATFGPITFELVNPDPPDGDGLAIDLTGYTVRGKVRKTFASASAIATFTVEVLNQTTNKGKFTILLSDTVTSAITAGEKITDSKSKYVWDIELVDGASRVVTLFRGPFLVEAEATK